MTNLVNMSFKTGFGKYESCLTELFIVKLQKVTKLGGIL